MLSTLDSREGELHLDDGNTAAAAAIHLHGASGRAAISQSLQLAIQSC
jgi:hypothetical protein